MRTALILILLLTGCQHLPKAGRLIPEGAVSAHADTAGKASKTIGEATSKIVDAQSKITAAAAAIDKSHPGAHPEVNEIEGLAAVTTGETVTINRATLMLDELQADLNTLSDSVAALEGEKADLADALADKDAEIIKMQQDAESRRQKIYLWLTSGLIGLGSIILAVCLGYLRNMPGAATGGVLMASGLAMWALQPYLPYIVGATVILVLLPYIYQLYDHDKHRSALEEQVMNDDPDVNHAVKTQRTEDLMDSIRHKARRKFKRAGE